MTTAVISDLRQEHSRCRQREAAALDWAASALDPDERERWREIAQRWRELAEQVEADIALRARLTVS